MAASLATHVLNDPSSLVLTILHWVVVMVNLTETWAEYGMVELGVGRREVEPKHAPADPTLPLIVRCRLRVGSLDSGLKV